MPRYGLFYALLLCLLLYIPAIFDFIRSCHACFYTLLLCLLCELQCVRWKSCQPVVLQHTNYMLTVCSALCWHIDSNYMIILLWKMVNSPRPIVALVILTKIWKTICAMKCNGLIVSRQWKWLPGHVFSRYIICYGYQIFLGTCMYTVFSFTD